MIDFVRRHRLKKYLSNTQDKIWDYMAAYFKCDYTIQAVNHALNHEVDSDSYFAKYLRFILDKLDEIQSGNLSHWKSLYINRLSARAKLYRIKK